MVGAKGGLYKLKNISRHRAGERAQQQLYIFIHCSLLSVAAQNISHCALAAFPAFDPSVNIARESAPPEMFRATNLFCIGMRVP
jgi:hypothetical protein